MGVVLGQSWERDGSVLGPKLSWDRDGSGFRTVLGERWECFRTEIVLGQRWECFLPLSPELPFRSLKRKKEEKEDRGHCWDWCCQCVTG